jgi:hypothetical protein
MNQVIDATGNVSHTVDVVTPEMVDDVVATNIPIQLNPDERQDAPQPEWMLKIIKRQFRLAKKYHRARNLALEIYNIALDEIETINNESGTNFTLAKFLEEFQGYPAYVPDEESEE